MFFNRKKQPAIRSLIGEGTQVHGELRFDAGLRVDGEVLGDVIATEPTSLLVISENARVQGKVIAKSSLADFATQRDINGGRKRDIKTVQIKLLIPNPDERYVPGMTADVYVPKAKLVKQ